jgi:hypothetical protein
MRSRIGKRQAKAPEWEVLPPDDQPRSQRTRAALESRFRWLALIMDDFLRVPGTKLRFGLDPIIGLLPGIGDVTSAIVSAVAFVHAARSGVPKILLARMAMNILINERGRDNSGAGRCVFVLVQVERAQLRIAPPVLCRARAIQKRRLDICHCSSQPAVCYCLRRIDRDGPRIG